MKDYLRIQRLKPYLKGRGPQFLLATWDTGRLDNRGQAVIGYQLKQFDMHAGPNSSRVIFEAEDFSGSPMHADDSDATLGSLLCFLTLMVGDTDDQYFETYNKVQREFCENHAETLSMEAIFLEESAD